MPSATPEPVKKPLFLLIY